MRGPILVVDDHRPIRDLLRTYFERDGFSVLTAGTGAAAIELAQSARPALVVLDLGLPDVGGETVLREIRTRSEMPVLVLSARAGEEDRLAGLGLGADDYVTKPFSPREVALRVRAILRRTAQGGTDVPPAPLRFENGALVIDVERHEVRCRDAPVTLTPTEWRILLALIERPGRALSRAEILDRAQGYASDGSDRMVDAHVKNLRRKIEPDPRSPRLIGTVPGMGYRFDGRSDA